MVENLRRVGDAPKGQCAGRADRHRNKLVHRLTLLLPRRPEPPDRHNPEPRLLGALARPTAPLASAIWQPRKTNASVKFCGPAEYRCADRISGVRRPGNSLLAIC